MALRATIKKRLKRRGSAIVHLREVALVVAAYFAYMVVRKVAFIGGEEVAFRNALKIISFEQSIGLFWEPVAQEWALNVGHWLITLFNWLYIITYWPVVLTTAVIVYLFDRKKYFYYRNVLLLSFAMALVVFAVFPLSPPRMIAGYGWVDTIKAFGPSWYSSREMMVYYNAFAAMPSLHFAWTVVFGVLFFKSRFKLLKVLGVFYPLLTLLAIVATANHYIIDAAVGAVLMAATYGVYEVFFLRRHRVRLVLLGVAAHLPKRQALRWSAWAALSKRVFRKRLRAFSLGSRPSDRPFR